MTTETTTCKRCGEEVPDDIREEIHLAQEHEAPWDEIDNYPRAPAKR